MLSARLLRTTCLACLVAAYGCSDTHSDSGSKSNDEKEHDHEEREHDKPRADAGKESSSRDAGKTETGETDAKDASAETDASAGPDASATADASASDAGMKPDDEPNTPSTPPAKPTPYLLSVIVFTPDTTTTYVHVLDSLDVKDLDLQKGIEFSGQANVAAHGGHVYISDGESPVITRYSLTSTKTLKKEASVSFLNLGETSVSVDDTANTFISKTKAYLAGTDGNTIVWNPDTLEIVGEIPVEFKETKTMPENMSLSGSSGFARGNRLYRTFFWFDWATYGFSDAQYIATYDTEKDKLLSLVSETRCPALSALISGDDEGTAYFSNWFYNLAGTLQNGGPSACALRLKPGTDTLDADWKLEFPKIASGHEGAQLSYTKDNQAVFAAFHQEEITVKTDDSPYDVVGGPHWEAWTLDLATQKAKPIAGVERMGAQQNVFTIDGRTFLFAPNQEFDRTKVYELKTDGTSRVVFEIKGWSRAFLKLD